MATDGSLKNLTKFGDLTALTENRAPKKRKSKSSKTSGKKKTKKVRYT